VEIEAAFNRQELCDAAGDWPEELIVLGWFTNGESFYGKAGIRIIAPSLKKLIELSTYWLQTGCKKPHWCDGLARISRQGLGNGRLGGSKGMSGDIL
jgi:hypothetical protein